MNPTLPKIDPRKAKDIYDQAKGLAKIYCPEWENAAQEVADEDIGIALLQLFAKLSETLIGQVNRIPEKHRLAFYEFIGIDHLPPTSARAPLTFLLSTGSSEATVPARTKISSSEDPTVTFETLNPLTAVSFSLSSVFSFNSWQDRYTEHTLEIGDHDTGFYIFGGDETEKPAEHILYIADDLFDFSVPVKATIKFAFKTGNPADFIGYFSSASGSFTTSPQELIVSFDKITVPKISTPYDGEQDNWISFRPTTPLPFRKEELPVLSRITCEVSAEVTPDAIFCNSTPADIKKGFYPFGETPKVGDTLYIGCKEAFSKDDSTITFTLNLQGGTTPNPADLSLVWEYWTGTAWKAFSTTSDNTNKLTSTGAKIISFTAPSIETAEINGVSNKWVRVRIDSGGYGEGAKYKEIKSNDDIVNMLDISSDAKAQLKNNLNKYGFALGMQYSEATYKPPFISSFSINCTRSRPVKRCKTYNNFSYTKIETVDDANPLIPFSARYEERPSFYLGFESYPADKPITLYYPLKGLTFGETIPKIYPDDQASPVETRGLTWEYYDQSDTWQPLGPEDGTGSFSTSGIVTFVVPPGIRQKEEFNKNLYWIRVRLEDGNFFNPPKLKSIFPNTVWAENATILRDELLGTSNGQPGQTFDFSSNPVLENQVIEILEPNNPSEDELRTMISESGTDPLRIIKNDSGDILEVWVQWKEVRTFAHSKPSSRHYVIDRSGGSLLFGDGLNGMIPPVLPNNIVAREYRTGGGEKGNQKAGKITDMKTAIPNIQEVKNYDASSGGADLEAIPDLLTRAPYSIKNRDRAVTKEDFEWLAMESSPDISKAKCIHPDQTTINVIIAPRYRDGSLYPETSLIDYVKAYISNRALPSIRNYIHVESPRYTGVDIEAEVVPVSLSESAVIKNTVEKTLKEFLNPVSGGADGTGWNFGEPIFFSKIAALIEDLDGVNYIKTLKIQGETGKSFIPINETDLPQPGKITVHLMGG